MTICLRRIAFCLAALAARVAAYVQTISDTDDLHQVCSGMWAGGDTHIEVSFDPSSHGQLAMVIYEWSDVDYLGKVTSESDYSLPKTYVCTTDAVNSGFCTSATLGQFIVDLPSGMTLNQTSIWTASVTFASNSTSDIVLPPITNGSDLWNNPAGNPVVPAEDEEYSSPFLALRALFPRQSILRYSTPIQYPITKKGYYCVGTIPITILTQGQPDTADHAAFTGSVLFRNVFDGLLPASEYPKIWFYLGMTWGYALVGAVWAYMCFRHRQDLLPLQYYIASLIGLLVIEMLANWGYYRYLNAHGDGITSTAFLIVVAILDAGRNSLSFFLLLVVSLGLSVVKESLGSIMTRCVILGIAHFVFGVIYAIGTVEITLETASILLLLSFVVPLAFTLSCFLLWIMYALNGTIAELSARKQRYKLSMFTRLYRILLVAVIIMAVFFVVSSMSFSNRLAEDYASNSWSSRWWLLDGWLALLYLAVFISIAYIWRPSDNNRYLAMVDEIAQDAEDYDLESIERRQGPKDEDEDDHDHQPLAPVGRDDVVFEIGEEEGEDEGHVPRTARSERERGGGDDEREGLMGGNGHTKDHAD